MSRTSYAPPPGLFPRAAAYPGVAMRPGVVREPAEPGGRPFWTERHLQCIWYDPRLRPPLLRTAEGERVGVEHPGAWNLEAGPDFLGASVRVGRGRRRIEGDVEVHVRPSDWGRHGHGEDPRYGRVRLHLTWYPGPAEPALQPPGALLVPLQPVLAACPAFSFDLIDVAAYPYAARSDDPPCRRVLAARGAAARAALLEAAGEERLRRKTALLQASVEQHGEEQALYAEVLAALGYKNNKAACRRLAAGLPVSTLREASGGDPGAAYALLLGTAGLLPAVTDSSWGPVTRAFIRSLWDAWWSRGAALTERVLPAGSWTLAGLRPANHPRRRLAAAARLFAPAEPLGERLVAHAERSPRTYARDLVRRLSAPGDGYWERRLKLDDRILPGRVALLGPSRAAALAANVFIPFAAARTGRTDGLLDRLPSAGEHALARRAADALFGRDHNPSLYRGELRRQGLTQIYLDFCLRDRSGCRSCALVRSLGVAR